MIAHSSGSACMADSPLPTLRRGGGGGSAFLRPPACHESVRARVGARAQRLLAAALLLAALLGARAQPPAPMQPSAELPGEEQCAVSIHYDASLGSGGSRQYIAQAPIFTGTVTVQNNGNVSGAAAPGGLGPLHESCRTIPKQRARARL